MNNFLLHPKIPLWKYCFIVTPIAIVPALVLFKIAEFIFRINGLEVQRFSAPEHDLSAWGAFGTIIIAPIIETLLLTILIVLLSSFVFDKIKIAIICGLLSGLAHGLFGLLWFFAPAWGFFILSCAFLAWRDTGIKTAYTAALLPHIANNAIFIFIAINNT